MIERQRRAQAQTRACARGDPDGADIDGRLGRERHRGVEVDGRLADLELARGGPAIEQRHEQAEAEAHVLAEVPHVRDRGRHGEELDGIEIELRVRVVVAIGQVPAQDAGVVAYPQGVGAARQIDAIAVRGHQTGRVVPERGAVIADDRHRAARERREVAEEERALVAGAGGGGGDDEGEPPEGCAHALVLARPGRAGQSCRGAAGATARAHGRAAGMRTRPSALEPTKAASAPSTTTESSTEVEPARSHGSPPSTATARRPVT